MIHVCPRCEAWTPAYARFCSGCATPRPDAPFPVPPQPASDLRAVLGDPTFVERRQRIPPMAWHESGLLREHLVAFWEGEPDTPYDTWVYERHVQNPETWFVYVVAGEARSANRKPMYATRQCPHCGAFTERPDLLCPSCLLEAPRQERAPRPAGTDLAGLQGASTADIRARLGAPFWFDDSRRFGSEDRTSARGLTEIGHYMTWEYRWRPEPKFPPNPRPPRPGERVGGTEGERELVGLLFFEYRRDEDNFASNATCGPLAGVSLFDSTRFVRCVQCANWGLGHDLSCSPCGAVGRDLLYREQPPGVEMDTIRGWTHEKLRTVLGEPYSETRYQWVYKWVGGTHWQVVLDDSRRVADVNWFRRDVLF
jgi:hypothetical protein